MMNLNRWGGTVRPRIGFWLKNVDWLDTSAAKQIEFSIVASKPVFMTAMRRPVAINRDPVRHVAFLNPAAICRFCVKPSMRAFHRIC